ncbi:50S ribosomal protein L32 [Candidatus Giovannonibacteria bacterium RIFCSPLOWO2_02_FULL_43_11b]|nr:MAG: 50S ribosomal protein L32 [Candidatus Giovannonibacteria bacterium RIFCSPLOWO2_02_FULL_43_11b]
MVVRMRSTRSHTGNRRSHHALSHARFSICKDCGSAFEPHHMCRNCGKYKGRIVIDVKAIIAKKEKRRKEKLKAMGEASK